MARLIPSLLVIILLCLGCSAHEDPSIHLASTGVEAYAPSEARIVRELKEIGHDVRHVETGNLKETAAMVSSHPGHLATLPADLLFSLYTADDKTFANIRGLAQIDFLYLHIILAGDPQFEDLRDLKGKSIGFDAEGESGESILFILEMSGLDRDELSVVASSPTDILEALRKGRLQAAFLFSQAGDPGIASILSEGGFSLKDLEHPVIASLREINPFMLKKDIPSEVYGTSTDFRTVGIPLVLVGSEDLDEGVAYLLASRFMGPAGHLLPIPLHKAAERLARERGFIQ